MLKAVELRSVREALARTTEEAVGRGVTSVPAIWRSSAVYYGEAGLDAAAELRA